MAKKEIMLPQKWISTPFAYTQFARNRSLLQQDVLLKVSAHLQDYLAQYYGNSELRDSPKRPKPLFSDLDKESGLMQFCVNFAELGVAPNNYPAVKKAVEEVLSTKVLADVVDKETGKPVRKMYNVFSYAPLPAEGVSEVVFGLNPDVVDWVFDMRYGYVRHPEDIARISTTERMPMIYYLLKHRSLDWKKPHLELTVSDIKEYLGMIEYVDELDEDGNPTGIKRKEEAYPKFSQFKKKVLEVAVADINRLKAEGKIDVEITKMQPVYPGTRKTGTPMHILFEYSTKKPKEAKQEQKVEARELLPGEAEWEKFLRLYNGLLTDKLRAFQFRGEKDGVVFLHGNEAMKKDLARIVKLHSEEVEKIKQALYEAYGKEVRTNL